MSEFFEPPAIDIPGEGDLYCRIETRLGTIEGKLYEDSAPATVANFVGLATGATTGEAFYDGIIFHRVIPNFMVQAGCPLGRGTGGPGYRIRDEFGAGLRHDKPGLFSMANAGPNTGGSQFFITERALPMLDNKFAVFGVCNNLDVIRRIARVPVLQTPKNRPRTQVKIQRVEVMWGKWSR